MSDLAVVPPAVVRDEKGRVVKGSLKSAAKAEAEATPLDEQARSAVEGGKKLVKLYLEVLEAKGEFKGVATPRERMDAAKALREMGWGATPTVTLTGDAITASPLKGLTTEELQRLARGEK